MTSSGDADVLDYARNCRRIVLTHNVDDFRALHQNNSDHPGIFAIYQEKNLAKGMSRAEVVRAIANIEAAGIDLCGQFIGLNAWK